MKGLIVEINNVWFAYNGHAVLEDVSLDIGRNEVVSMIGPSGCGKSTVDLRLILALSKVVGDLERAGDKTVRIAWCLIKLLERDGQHPPK